MSDYDPEAFDGADFLSESRDIAEAPGAVSGSPDAIGVVASTSSSIGTGSARNDT